MGTAPLLSSEAVNPYLAIFVAGVLTGVAGVVIARLTPDVIAAGRQIATRIHAARR